MIKKMMICIVFFSSLFLFSSATFHPVNSVSFETYINYMNGENYFDFIPLSFDSKNLDSNLYSVKYYNTKTLFDLFNQQMINLNPAHFTKTDLLNIENEKMTNINPIEIINYKIVMASCILDFLNDINQSLKMEPGFTLGGDHLTMDATTIKVIDDGEDIVYLDHINVSSTLNKNITSIYYHMEFNNCEQDMNYDIYIEDDIKEENHLIINEIDFYLIINHLNEEEIQYKQSIIVKEGQLLNINNELNYIDDGIGINFIIKDALEISKSSSTKIEYSLTSNTLNNEEVKILAIGNNEEGHLYLQNKLLNEEIFGTQIPAQIINCFFAYNNQQKLLATSFDLDSKLKKCSEDNICENKTLIYSGYAVDMHLLAGYDELKAVKNHNKYEAYLKNELIFGGDDEFERYDDNNTLLAIKTIIDLGNERYYLIHVENNKALNQIDEKHFDETNLTIINNQMKQLSTFAISINLQDTKYQIKDLDRSNYY